jgi:hypothetical protein
LYYEADIRIGHILCRSCLLKHGITGKTEGKGREDEEEVVSSYWMKLRKRQDTVN